MFAEEARVEEESNFPPWYNRQAAICLNTDGDDGTFNTEDSGDEYSAQGSGVDSDDVDKNDDDGDDDDTDFNDNDGFLGENDDNVIDTFEDDVPRFRNMGFLVECGLPGRMNSARHHHWGPGPSHHDHRRHRHRHHQHHHRPHCPSINWIRQPDLYKEFNFKPPSGNHDSV